MHRRQPADNRVILHHHVPGECAVVAENHMVADDAVVRDVRVRQKVSVRSDSRVQVIAGRSMHRCVFAEHVVRADVEVAFPAGIFQILCFQADTGERVKLVARSDGCQAVDHDVRMQPATVAEFHVRADNGIRPDFAAGAKLRSRIDNGGWMDHLPASFYTNSPRRSTLRLANLPEI